MSRSSSSLSPFYLPVRSLSASSSSAREARTCPASRADAAAPQTVIMSQIEPMFIMSRMTYIREASSKMYSPVVFALSQLAAEMPYSILCSVVFFLLICASSSASMLIIAPCSTFSAPVATVEARCATGRALTPARTPCRLPRRLQHGVDPRRLRLCHDPPHRALLCHHVRPRSSKTRP